jgi:hypothetical protein
MSAAATAPRNSRSKIYAAPNGYTIGAGVSPIFTVVHASGSQALEIAIRRGHAGSRTRDHVIRPEADGPQVQGPCSSQ